MKRLLILAIALLIVTFTAATLDFDLTGQAGVGYSIVDVPASTGWSAAQLAYWNEFNFRFNVEGTWGFGDTGSFRAGLELGYSWLYYYETIPLPTVYYGYAGAFNASAIGEYRFGEKQRFAAQFGAGAYIFSDGTSFGINAAGTYRFRINDNMAIPLGIRVDVIFGRSVIVPIDLMVGFSYRFLN